MSDDANTPLRPVSPGPHGPEHQEPRALQREVWGTRVGFLLAAVGSAVGLGNMWRFPYITAEHGGAAFVIIYILALFAVGIPIMLAEFTIGRRTRLSPIGALRQVGGSRWLPLGYLFVLTGALILAYYSVIAGWVTRYAIRGLLQGFPSDVGAFFADVSQGYGAIGYHLFFMALTTGIVMVGIEKGIERASLIMMPTLFVLVIGLAAWAFTLPGGGQGYAFYLAPNPSALLSLDTLAAAAGQVFFSLSLGMGAMLTFSSYLSRHESLAREAAIISFSDFGVAFTAGLAVFPVIFAFGLQGQVGESTIGTLFLALPRGFVEMGGIGRLVGITFFAALLIAALTSAISLLEVVTASLIDEWRLNRKVAAVGAGAVISLVGFWPAMDIDVLGAMDSVAGELFLVVGALFMAVFVGWLLRNPFDEVLDGAGPGMRRLAVPWLWMLRIVSPLLLVPVLIEKIAAAWTALADVFGR